MKKEKKTEGPTIKPKVISIIGRSGSGKTTLLTRLIPRLKEKGLRVGTIKHTHHDVEQDNPGKDSWKHRQSGSDQVLLVTGNKLTIHTENNEELGLKELSEKWFQNFDVVISEGFKQENGIKVEISRHETGKSPLCLTPSFGIEAVISNHALNTDAIWFALDDFDAFFQWILKRLKL